MFIASFSYFPQFWNQLLIDDEGDEPDDDSFDDIERYDPGRDDDPQVFNDIGLVHDHAVKRKEHEVIQYGQYDGQRYCTRDETDDQRFRRFMPEINEIYRQKQGKRCEQVCQRTDRFTGGKQSINQYLQNDDHGPREAPVQDETDEGRNIRQIHGQIRRNERYRELQQHKYK